MNRVDDQVFPLNSGVTLLWCCIIKGQVYGPWESRNQAYLWFKSELKNAYAPKKEEELESEDSKLHIN